MIPTIFAVIGFLSRLDGITYSNKRKVPAGLAQR